MADLFLLFFLTFHDLIGLNDHNAWSENTDHNEVVKSLKNYFLNVRNRIYFFVKKFFHCTDIVILKFKKL